MYYYVVRKALHHENSGLVDWTLRTFKVSKSHLLKVVEKVYVLSEMMPVWKEEDEEPPDVCDDARTSEVGTSSGFTIAMLTHCEKWVLVIVAVLSVRLASALSGQPFHWLFKVHKTR